MANYIRLLYRLAATVVLLGSAGLWAQSPCTSNLFTITSSSGTNFPAAGGSTTLSWSKGTGGSNACPSFITTTAPWLTLQSSNSSSTTGSSGLLIGPNLSSATRTGVIMVQSSADDATNFSITQTGSTLTVDVTSLTFSAPGGTIPTPQTINVGASGGAVQIAASVTSTGNWLSVSVSSPTAPSAVTVSANPTGLAAGTYQGTVVIVGASLQVPVNVTLTVTAPGPALSFNPASLTISSPAGSSSQSGAAVLRNAGASTVFTLLTDQPWLTASSAGNSTLGPGQSTPVTMTASAANLQPGSYTGHVTAQGSGASVTLTVTFNVTGVTISALVNPISLTISSGTKKTFPGVEQLAGSSASVAISVTLGSNFLSADATAMAPGTFGITIDATSLSPGNYNGALLVQCTSVACVPVPVQVAITVNAGTGSLNFTPTAATLSMTAGSSTPQTASISLENDGSSTTSFTLATDQSWLSATPATGTLAAGQKTAVSVSASTASLAPGSYTGHVLAQGTSTTGTYTVSLTVSGANVTVSPNPLTVSLPAGNKQVFPGIVQLGGDAASIAISVTQGNAYLSADVLSQSPGTFSITVDATKLTPGTYAGALALHCSPGCIPIAVSISIVVTQGSTNLSFGSAGVTLTGNAGSPTPQTATTTLLNAGNGPGSFAFSIDQTWLSATPSSGTLATGQSVNITVSAASQNLAPGSYTGHLTVGGAVFTVNFTVAGVSLYALPNPASFSVSEGTKQTFTTVQVLGGGGPVSISVTSGSIWLSADLAVQAPGSFNITIDATYLKPGNYAGALAFTCQAACVPFNLPISLTVTSNGALTFGPSTVSIISYSGRPAPAPQTVTVKSTDGTAINFTVTNPFSWLSVSPMSGTTPTTLTLTPNLAGITSGASGNLSFTTPNSQSPILLPVMLSLPAFTISATPNPVTLSAVTGRLAQTTLNVSTADTGQASLQISTTNFWLSAPASFTAPGSLTIKADASSLGVGLYPGMLTIACASANPCASLQVPVSFMVTGSAILLSDTTSIAFPLPSTGTGQPSAAVHLTSSDSSTTIPYTIDPTSLPSWLTLTADQPATPATLSFSVPNPPTHQASANVKINSAFGSVVIAVTYTLQTGPAINPAGVVSAGGFSSNLRSGSWATIYGNNLSTTAGRDWGPSDFNGNAFPTSLDGVSVTVGGQPAYVRSISPTQINIQCPDGIGTGAVPVTVTNSLGTSNTVLAMVANYAPAFFIGTTAGTGASLRSYVAATESPSGGTVYIGPANTAGVRPAADGENLTLWGTGFGPTMPNVPAGSIFNGAAPLNDPVQVLIDGVPVTPQFAGLSGAGLDQINIVVPNLAPGDHQLTAMIGGVTTANGIWLSIQ